MWMPGGWWGMGWGLGMVVFWALVIAAVVWLLRSAGQRSHAGGPRESALEILQRRYASGEIGREEYEQKRRDLGGPSERGGQR